MSSYQTEAGDLDEKQHDVFVAGGKDIGGIEKTPDADDIDVESVLSRGDAVERQQTRDSDAPPPLPFSKARCIALVATVAGAGFTNTLGIQAVVIILPTIGKDLNIPESRLQWIVSAYSLTFGCFLLFWGRIGDIYGKRTVFILGTAWVAITTAINPFLPNEIAFDLFRGLQGLGAAANVPTAIGILGTTFPPGKAKNYAFSFYAGAAPLGAVFGNIVAGIVSSYASWKWVFGVLAIIAAVITVAGILIIPPPPHTLHDEGVKAKKAVDWIGAILITVGLLALLFGLTEGNVVGWSTPWVPVLIAISVILVTLFVFWQRHLEKGGTSPPLMKVSIFHSTQFSAAMVVMALLFSNFNGFLVYSTYFYQDYQGLSALQTTLRFLPNGVVGVLTVLVVSQLVARVPAFWLMIFGNLCVTIASLLLAAPIPTDTSYFAYGMPAMALSVLGVDTMWPCITLFVSHALPQSDQALGGALVNATGQVGRSIGLAIATAIQTAIVARERGTSVSEAGPMLAWDDPTLQGIRAASWFDFALGVCTVLVVAFTFRGSGVVGKAGVKSRLKRAEQPRSSPAAVLERNDGGAGRTEEV